MGIRPHQPFTVADDNEDIKNNKTSVPCSSRNNEIKAANKALLVRHEVTIRTVKRWLSTSCT